MYIIYIEFRNTSKSRKFANNSSSVLFLISLKYIQLWQLLKNTSYIIIVNKGLSRLEIFIFNHHLNKTKIDRVFIFLLQIYSFKFKLFVLIKKILGLLITIYMYIILVVEEII